MTLLEPTEETTVTHAEPSASVSPLARLAAKHGVDYRGLEAIMLKTVIKGQASREEILAFLMVCDKYGLDPITKQVYAMKSKGGGLVPIVGVDGWAHLVAADARCDGFTFTEHNGENGEIVSVTCRMAVVGRRLDTEVTEYLSECHQNTQPWNSMPRRMLRHKALMQAARIVFGINGIYDEDEGRVIADAPVRQLTDREEGAEKLKKTLDAAHAAKTAKPETDVLDADVVEPTKPEPIPETLLTPTPTWTVIELAGLRKGVTNDKKKLPYRIVETTDRETLRCYRADLFDLLESARKDGVELTVQRDGDTIIEAKAS